MAEPNGTVRYRLEQLERDMREVQQLAAEIPLNRERIATLRSDIKGIGEGLRDLDSSIKERREFEDERRKKEQDESEANRRADRRMYMGGAFALAAAIIGALSVLFSSGVIK